MAAVIKDVQDRSMFKDSTLKYARALSGPLHPNAPSVLLCTFPRPASPTSSTYPVGCPSPT